MEPKEVGIALTNACNAQCRMCYTWKEKNIQQFDSALIEKLPKSLTNLVLSGDFPINLFHVFFIRYKLKGVILFMIYLLEKLVEITGYICEKIRKKYSKN